MTHKASYAIIMLLISVFVYIVGQAEIHNEQLMWIIAGVLLLVVIVLALNLYQMADIAEASIRKVPQKSSQAKSIIKIITISLVISIVIFFLYIVDLLGKL